MPTPALKKSNPITRECVTSALYTHTITPTSTDLPYMYIQAIGPKIQHRPSPPYHDPYARPPPRPPDVTNSIDSQKDLLETDLDRYVDIEKNSPFQEGNNFRDL